MNLFIITIDKGVEQRDRQGIPSWHERYRDILRSMVMGDSFFLKDETEQSIEPLIRYASKIDINLIAESTDYDEIFFQPGVRIWKGNFADKSRTGQPANRYFIDVVSNEPYALVGDTTTRNETDVEISQADFVTHLHNWRQIVRERKSLAATDVVGQMFDRLAKSGTSGMIIGGKVQVVSESELIGQIVDPSISIIEKSDAQIIYWKQVDGSMCKGTYAEYQSHQCNGGQVTQAEYDAWDADQL